MLGLSLVVLFSSCATKTAIKPGDTLEVAFSKAKSLYDKSEYGDAARAFETVISMGRGSDLAREAQWLIAESYYKNKEYLIAASEYRRFITFYPRSPQRMDAEYMEAYCYYKISPRYKLDQADTERAITLFRIFIGRYPDTDKSKDAIKLLDELRAKLALKSISAADMYMNLKLYLSAAMFYQTTVDKYPETKYAEESLAKQVKAYALYADLSIESKQAERYKMAIDAYEKYKQLFPNGKNRAIAEDYARYAQRLFDRIQKNQSSDT
jgi:outer membrane protein assembly factor BamD